MAFAPISAMRAIHLSYVLSLGGNSDGYFPGKAAPRLTALIHSGDQRPAASRTSKIRLPVLETTVVDVGRARVVGPASTIGTGILARYESAVESPGAIWSARAKLRRALTGSPARYAAMPAPATASYEVESAAIARRKKVRASVRRLCRIAAYPAPVSAPASFGQNASARLNSASALEMSPFRYAVQPRSTA